MFPHEQIRMDKDRSWSFKLVDAIASGQCDDLDDVEETLWELDDPRTVAPLLTLIKNTNLPVKIRKSASDALSGIKSEMTSQQRVEWWHSRDQVLKRFALLIAERSEGDIVEAVAKEPNHPYHLEAIVAIQYWDDAKYQYFLIDALNHPDLKVRTYAASAVKWEESFKAENGLLLNAADPDPDLRDKSLYTLEWYKSRNVLLGLELLKNDGPESFRDQYCDSLSRVTRSMIEEISYLRDEKLTAKLDCWLKPVAHLLEAEEKHVAEFSLYLKEIDANFIKKQKFPKISGEKTQRNISYIISLLNDESSSWSQKYHELRSIDWTIFPISEQKILADYLSMHPDLGVRAEGCEALALWNMPEKLIELLDDSNWAVARAAGYRMKNLPRDESLAPLLWTFIHGERASGSMAREAFESFLIHAPEKGLDDILIDLANHKERELFKVEALWELSCRENVAALQSLSKLLQAEPLLTWNVHATYLDVKASHQEIKADYSHLQEIDELNLQLKIVELDAAS